MDLQLTLILAGLLIGIVVGMTGMGGGALMTPVLVLFFGVPPLAAVSSDLVVSAVMKPVGGVVHLRRGTVDLRLVGLRPSFREALAWRLGRQDTVRMKPVRSTAVVFAGYGRRR